MEEKTSERVEGLIFTAVVYGWSLLNFDGEKRVVRFKRDGTKLSFFYERGRVITKLRHPKKGQTRLLRRGVTLEIFEELLHYPRAHTKTKAKLI